MTPVKLRALLLATVAFCNLNLVAQTITESFDSPPASLNIVGRGSCKINNGTLKSKDSYLYLGDDNLKNYRASFRARAPKGSDQVQIWAGFHAYNRFDRYIIGLKGGLQDDLHLSRMGYMGADELLALTDIDFHPEVGQWYKFKVEVCADRIRIFLNDEALPRIDVVDKNMYLAPTGGVTLGGGWVETEFDDLKIEPLSANALDGVSNKVYQVKATAQQKETERKKMRADYKPVVVDKIKQGRTDISLEGNWLFMPDYDANKEKELANLNIDDSKWHVMSVPNFWTPIRIWLHGETMQPNRAPKGVSDTYYQQETDRCEGYTFEYNKIKFAWYRQWVELPEGINDKQVMLNFDAVSKVADVYINGVLASSHVGMFGDFQVDGSKLFKPGKNLVAVKVSRTVDSDGSKSSASQDDLNQATDFYYSSVRDSKVVRNTDIPLTSNVMKDLAHGFYGDNPAGIWQPVSLIITDPIKVEDVYIKPELDGADFEVTLKNSSTKAAKLNLLTEIVENQTGNVFYKGESLQGVELKAGEAKVVKYSIRDLKPRLWSPESPNLYDFNFKLVSDKNVEIDMYSVLSGFRTFRIKNGLFELNGNPYWLRGGNHTPFALAPNDEVLANSFYQIMKAGNIDITRTHTTPYNKLWITAADKNGIGISHEGTWPWLMIHSTMPDMSLIDMWADEYIALLKKYRNHPSILFWTINNEMKFYDNEPDKEKRLQKMNIIESVVKRMREVDPTRPISFDSNYTRREGKFGKDFFKTFDDGDIDDMHSYINWYNHTVFKEFNGEFQKQNKNEGRPLISQEMSTGYANNETGHATRFYTLVHQNPQTLIGYQAYAYGDPELFLKVQSFITGELAEALRRSNDKASGIIHFALLTWFRNVYNAETIEPYPTYYAMQRALQPVLASAEIWGRNFYAGGELPTKVCIVNDLEDGRDLKPGILNWWIEAENGRKIASGKMDVPAVGHYKRVWVTPKIEIPENLPASKMNAKLKIRFTEDGKQMSVNEYDILLAQKEWTQTVAENKKIVLMDANNSASVLNLIGAKHTKTNSIAEALKAKADLVVLSGLGESASTNELYAVRKYIANGGKVLLLNSENASKTIFPEYITDWFKPTEGDIANMEIPESSVFDNIELLELRYFNNEKREVPTVCHTAMRVNRNDNVEELANHTKIHGYIDGDMDKRSEYVKTIKGYPILKITENKGQAIVSTMAHEKAMTDPIAARLLANMINDLLK